MISEKIVLDNASQTRHGGDFLFSNAFVLV